MRPYDSDELRNCVGKRVVDMYETVSVITAYSPMEPNPSVRVGGVWVTSEELLSGYTFTNGVACGVPI